jgi:hypothetical protein
MKQYFSAIAVAFALLGAAGSLAAQDPLNAQGSRVYQIQERTGTKHSDYQIRLEAAAGTWHLSFPEHAMELGADLSTTRWTWTVAGGGTAIDAVRNGATITLEGSFKGQPVRKSIDAGRRPWAQDIRLYLEAFAARGERQAVFLGIQPGELKDYELRAELIGLETITIRDQPLSARHYRVTLTGLLALFWKSDYWFDARNGRFLRYEAVDASPGNPTTIIETIGLEEQP